MISIPYLAGFYEGEGCIEQTSTYGFRINILSTDFDVIERIHQTFGGTLNQVKQQAKHHKPCWKWRLGRNEQVYDLLVRMLPYLGLRRSYDALNALDTIDRI